MRGLYICSYNHSYNPRSHKSPLCRFTYNLLLIGSEHTYPRENEYPRENQLYRRRFQFPEEFCSDDSSRRNSERRENSEVKVGFPSDNINERGERGYRKNHEKRGRVSLLGFELKEPQKSRHAYDSPASSEKSVYKSRGESHNYKGRFSESVRHKSLRFSPIK